MGLKFTTKLSLIFSGKRYLLLLKTTKLGHTKKISQKFKLNTKISGSLFRGISFMRLKEKYVQRKFLHFLWKRGEKKERRRQT